MTETKTALVAWNGETYKGASDFYDKFKNDPEFLEYTEDMDNDEILRLAMFADNGGWGLVPDDMDAFIAQEQEAFCGEYESEAEFTRELLIETGTLPEDLPNWICIDYQLTWDTALRFDFFSYAVVDVDGNYRKHFWNANL
jgi:hypothetical protein